MITVKNLKKSFGDNEVLKGIDYEIKQGEKIVIIGPSGSGKSTFLRCLNLLETPTEGEIYFDNQLITDKKCDINKIREHMGMVFQHFNLFNNKTILENITLAPVQLKVMTKEQANAKAMELLCIPPLPCFANWHLRFPAARWWSMMTWEIPATIVKSLIFSTIIRA